VSPFHALSVGEYFPSVEALNSRAHALRYTDMRAAVELTARAIDASDAEGDVKGCIRALRIRGSCLARLADMDGALKDLDRADMLLPASEDASEQAWVLSARAFVLHRLGDSTQAMGVAQRAIDQHRAMGDHSGEADSLNTAGCIADSVGDHARALEFYHSCRILCEEENDIAGLGSALGNIAAIHGRLGEHESAIEQFQRVLTLLAQTGNRTNKSAVYLNLGVAHAAVGHVDQALVHTGRGLDIARDLGERKNEVWALTNFGEIYLQQGDASVARQYFEEALALSLTLGLRFNEIEVRTRLGQTLVLLGEPKDAEEQLHAALAIAKSNGSLHRHEIQLALSELYRARGDFQRALHHHRGFHKTKESAWGAQASQRIRAAVVQAEIEQAESHAKLLHERNEALQAVNEEKTSLLARLAEQGAEVERLSLEDALTGVHNRRHLDAQLALEWQRWQRFGHTLTVALLDIDNFKAVNDTHGHVVGDAVLRALAGHLRRHMRRVDIVARYGGEEFALVFIETPLHEAGARCEQLCASIGAMEYASPVGALHLTVSIGVAAADEVSSPTSLLSCADARLYAAKRAGRNMVRAG
jgi:diguanylate cyclase (GGDEF)-like protein